MKTKKVLKQLSFLSFGLLAAVGSVTAQKSSDSAFKPSGKLWGQVFADAIYKGHSDSSTVKRGAGAYAGQTDYPKNINEFQFRRVYIGYIYDISPKFTAEVLLSAESNNNGQDVLGDGKFSPFIKYADLRIKNIYPGADLIIGQSATPAFTQSEAIWGYRSVEKTIADFHGTPSYDMGLSLQGKFDPKTSNYGYNVMIGDGSGAKGVVVNTASKLPAAKWFYGDIWAKFLDKKLILDLYADYYLLQRLPATATASTVNQGRNMIKLTAGYTTPKVSVGVEAFTNIFNDQMTAKEIAGPVDTLNSVVMGISAFVRGSIVKGKLGFFARYDAINPNTKVDNNKYASYTNLGSANAGTGNYANTSGGFYKETFITAGLDFTPDKNIHIMPNIWYNGYSNQSAVGSTYPATSSVKNYDLVYRITVAYTFNK